jgi:hypothetical protein
MAAPEVICSPSDIATAVAAAGRGSIALLAEAAAVVVVAGGLTVIDDVVST